MVVRTDLLRGMFLLLAAAAVCCGCAHHRQSPYAYAPPYAPPVYPQPGAPQQAVPAQPVAYPAAPAAVQTPLPPGTVMPMAPTTGNGGFSQTMPAPGVVPAGTTMPCPPTCDPCAGQGVTPVVYDGAVQTQPCPPGK